MVFFMVYFLLDDLRRCCVWFEDESLDRLDRENRSLHLKEGARFRDSIGGSLSLSGGVFIP